MGVDNAHGAEFVKMHLSHKREPAGFGTVLIGLYDERPLGFSITTNWKPNQLATK